ncbi:DUF7344 domain-containing protein [Natrinema gelatinilyticum]|uniref:DUF7344 domain-containing protein n=1 Tax=Natrinema gelatinilyticum TaxID=2961571 RepID=UPI0020C54651|nr:ArsR family transcriptional regulator [Natrinema gelatinilyticum]
MGSNAHRGGDNIPEPLSDVPTECYDVLRHPRRLRILEILGSRTVRLSLSELTTELLERTTAPSNGKGRHEVRTSLVHNHLPRLESYDIVDWDDDGVTLVDEPPVHPADLSTVLELCDSENAERLLETLVDPVRMRLLYLLELTDRPLTLEQLAGQLSASDREPFADQTSAKIALHHSHLPAMADVGVINYDRESQLVTRYDHVASISQ